MYVATTTPTCQRKQSLEDKYRPDKLDAVIGQPAVEYLKLLVANPRRSCWLLTGPPGTGKTCSAHLVADALCTVLSKHTFKANDMDIQTATNLFNRTLRFRPMDGAPFHVVIIEEFERCVSPEVRVFLKVALDVDVSPKDGGLPSQAIVLATSNDTSKIEPALLERFHVLEFVGSGMFAVLCQKKLADIWQASMGPHEPMPKNWRTWGWSGNRFSMRMAMRCLFGHLELAARKEAVA